MSTQGNFQDVLHTITRDITDHPRDLSRLYTERYGISRVTATKYINRLQAEGWITRGGSSTHPVFSAGHKRLVSMTYQLAALDEQTPWEEDFEPHFSMPPNIRGIAHHGFTEMLNNAIDHSEGTSVLCRMYQDNEQLWISIADDGIGIFRKISDAMSLPDQRLALLELSKGKFTTDPSRHSGEGVFFTSRMFDNFGIEANGLQYSHHEQQDVLAEEPETLHGTHVWMRIPVASQRTTKEVFDQYTSGPEDFTFNKTVVPMRLARLGNEQLISRSQAKRLIARFDRFQTVVLDFAGIDEIGQAFSDEVFRVYANANPAIELIPTNMSAQVEKMYRRARAHTN